jgi:hypothetical protein
MFAEVAIWAYQLAVVTTILSHGVAGYFGGDAIVREFGQGFLDAFGGSDGH